MFIENIGETINFSMKTLFFNEKKQFSLNKSIFHEKHRSFQCKIVFIQQTNVSMKKSICSLKTNDSSMKQIRENKCFSLKQIDLFIDNIDFWLDNSISLNEKQSFFMEKWFSNEKSNSSWTNQFFQWRNLLFIEKYIFFIGQIDVLFC